MEDILSLAKIQVFSVSCRKVRKKERKKWRVFCHSEAKIQEREVRKISYRVERLGRKKEKKNFPFLFSLSGCFFKKKRRIRNSKEQSRNNRT